VTEPTPFDLNAASGAEQDAWCELLLACQRADQPEYPEPTRRVMLSRMTPDSDERILGWVAREGGRLRGAAILTLFGAENAHLADLRLRVHPDARRRGTGRALAERAIGAAREDGRTAVAVTSLLGSPGDGFAAALGFRPVLDAVHNILRLSEVDDAAMRAWAAGAEAKTGGFELVRWQGAVPEELMAAFLAARTGMDDMPVGELDLRPQRSTAEIVRQIEESIRRQGCGCTWWRRGTRSPARWPATPRSGSPRATPGPRSAPPPCCRRTGGAASGCGSRRPWCAGWPRRSRS
jgi:GNAT superfamily N-acetyltransferase